LQHAVEAAGIEAELAHAHASDRVTFFRVEARGETAHATSEHRIETLAMPGAEELSVRSTVMAGGALQGRHVNEQFTDHTGEATKLSLEI
jgi:hypothetical protein